MNPSWGESNYFGDGGKDAQEKTIEYRTIVKADAYSYADSSYVNADAGVMAVKNISTNTKKSSTSIAETKSGRGGGGDADASVVAPALIFLEYDGVTETEVAA